MKTNWLAAISVIAVAVVVQEAQAQQYNPMGYYQPNAYNNPTQAYHLGNFYYYPYYYFPHNYWPATGPRWPEAVGQPYMPPPAYMAFPPFHEPNWRYDLWQPARYYRGFQFWLDQF